ncbi:hypothetical protein [Paenibacillus sp. PSB04]|uniref:hypothetical protein n=1 Tax=Paenibacillus sp. PSB04 TaxID=2866810 RepID=UPI0021F1798B|nr:hypothetical protein [Paenibacillus sp. PSB04]UYO03676.1 hypothetical protein K2F33_29135 [Paenibacillus sp. PSB04]
MADTGDTADTGMAAMEATRALEVMEVITVAEVMAAPVEDTAGDLAAIANHSAVCRMTANTSSRLSANDGVRGEDTLF